MACEDKDPCTFTPAYSIPGTIRSILNPKCFTLSNGKNSHPRPTGIAIPEMLVSYLLVPTSDFVMFVLLGGDTIDSGDFVFFVHSGIPIAVRNMRGISQHCIIY